MKSNDLSVTSRSSIIQPLFVSPPYFPSNFVFIYFALAIFAASKYADLGLTLGTL